MMTVVTGGAGSGKSVYAESLVLTSKGKNRIYIATMYPCDQESYQRIAKHREMRADKGFQTVECYRDLRELNLKKDSCILLECISNLVANEMFQDQGAGENTVEEVLKGVAKLKKHATDLIVVTNEINSDGGPYERETVRYQKYLGEINVRMGEMADRVIEVVYGIPCEIGGADEGNME